MPVIIRHFLIPILPYCFNSWQGISRTNSLLLYILLVFLDLHPTTHSPLDLSISIAGFWASQPDRDVRYSPSSSLDPSEDDHVSLFCSLGTFTYRSSGSARKLAACNPFTCVGKGYACTVNRGIQNSRPIVIFSALLFAFRLVSLRRPLFPLSTVPLKPQLKYYFFPSVLCEMAIKLIVLVSW